MRSRSLVASFGHAFAGIAFVVRTQPNFRRHLVAAVAAVALGAALRITLLEWIAVVLAILLVLLCEMVNTVVELTMDRISEHFHPLAKAAKDVAAGFVLLAAVGSLVVGALVFLPRLIRVLGPLR